MFLLNRNTKTVVIVPRVPTGPQQEGVAVRRFAGSKTVALASSTLFGDTDPSKVFGFLVSYRVRVKLIVSQAPLAAAVVAQVPVFIVARKAADQTRSYANGFLTDSKSSDSDSTFRARRYCTFLHMQAKHRGKLTDIFFYRSSIKSMKAF